MTHDQFRMLWRVSAGSSPTFPRVSDDDYRLLQSLRRRGYVRFTVTGECVITPSGRTALHDYDAHLADKRQKEADRRAKQNAEKDEQRLLRTQDIRRSWWQFFLGLILGWILGGFTPSQVWDYLASLW